MPKVVAQDDVIIRTAQVILDPHMLAPAQIATVTTLRLIMAVAESPD